VPRRSAVSFLDAARRPIDALEGARILVSSRRLGWPDVLVEAGHNGAWEVDDVTPADHYVALNVGAAPLAVEVKGTRGFRRELLDPGAVWVCPAGESFTHRVADPSAFALFTIAPARFAALTDLGPGSDDDGRPPALRRAYNLRAPQLDHVLRALVAEAETGGPSGLAFTDALVMAAARQLRRLASADSSSTTRDAPPDRARGGLAPEVRRRVLALIDARLATGVAVEELAREAGLSPAHFARAFRESVGRAPHQQLLARRLEHARALLDAARTLRTGRGRGAPGTSLSDIALSAGFADQAHFTRLFKRAYGVTPGAVLRG
jgi:AraC family transcriptional regulator